MTQIVLPLYKNGHAMEIKFRWASNLHQFARFFFGADAFFLARRQPRAAPAISGTLRQIIDGYLKCNSVALFPYPIWIKKSIRQIF